MRRQCPDLSAAGGHEAPPAATAEGLTPRQSRGVEAILQEPTLARAAAATGVNERTLRRWMAEPPFRSAVLAGRREAFSHAIGLTQRYAPEAVETLAKVMNDAGATPSARVTAAAVLLRFGREAIELDDLAERVEMLERVARGAGADAATRADSNGTHRPEEDQA